MVSTKGSINRDLLNEWRTTVYRTRPGVYFFNFHIKRPNGPKWLTLLAIDAATPHRDELFKKAMTEHHDTKVEIITSGMTLLHLADLSWNRSVKASFKKQWSEWMRAPKDQNKLNKKGNVKRPSYALLANLCLNAWNELPKQQIINSFTACDLGTRDNTLLHKRLKDLLDSGIITEPLPQEPTGLLDNESDNEESQKVIDFAEESI